MDNFKGTSGPWFVAQEGSADVLVTDSDNHRAVAKVTNYMMNGSQINNANLIAAAPELLEALQKAVDVIKAGPNVNYLRRFGAVNKAHSAIAKALGK